jgi:site-specific DNA-methyltransferase (adenine-specific)
MELASQKILLGDCLDVLANERNVPAIVADPPANIAFMGRSWDRAHPCDDYVLPCTPRSKTHERELRSEESFIRYWATRYAMAYDIADQHATAIIWTLPRTSHQTATALRRAGWDIRDNLVHLFGTGWAKTGNALAPGQEGWLLATKGKPDLDIDACRVPRGGESTARTQHRGLGYGGSADVDRVNGGDPRGSLPKNALLSHCEECVRVGVKRVKGGASINHNRDPLAYIETAAHGKIRKVTHDMTYTDDGSTESVPAWHCLAGCVCGARSKWDPEKPLPTCPCGEVWRWLCAVAEVNGQSGDCKVGNLEPHHRLRASQNLSLNGANGERNPTRSFGGDTGGASRFFNTFSYLSKCSSSERHAGCENLYWRANKKNPFGFDRVTREEWEMLPADQRAQGNVHPTVKSYRLMHWLHSLTGAKKIVDLCAGSGTGMITAALDGIEWIGAEMCPEAVTIAQARHAFWSNLHRDAVAAFMDQRPMKRILEIQNKATS